MIDQIVGYLVALPVVVGALIYVIKRVIALDLELRVHRLRANLRYLEALQASEELGFDKHRRSADVSPWVLALLEPEEAERCAREWAAHLHQRRHAGELKEALADRRSLTRRALVMAVSTRLRRVVSR